MKNKYLVILAVVVGALLQSCANSSYGPAIVNMGGPPSQMGGGWIQAGIRIAPPPRGGGRPQQCYSQQRMGGIYPQQPFWGGQQQPSAPYYDNYNQGNPGGLSGAATTWIMNGRDFRNPPRQYNVAGKPTFQ